MEEQSETILDDLVSALNPNTIAEMFDAIATSLDHVENVLEPQFQARIVELTSLRPPISSNKNNNNDEFDEEDDQNESSSAKTATTTKYYANSNSIGSLKPLSCYVNLLSLEADRILDLTSNLHIALDSIKADLAEARAADTSFDVDRKQSRRTFASKVSLLED